MIKDQPGLDVALKMFDGSPPQTEVKIDGVALPCIIRESSIVLWLDRGASTHTTRQWLLAAHPATVIRNETVGGEGWGVTSARVSRRIGEQEFQCIEIRKWMRFYHQGPNDSLTTQYLCPEVPGHLVEEIQKFFKVRKGQRSSAPYQVAHQQVVALKIPN